MKTVVIGFSRGRGIIAWLIQLLTRSKISHTYLRVKSPTNIDMVFQASGLTVNIETYQHFLTHADVVDEIALEIPDELYAEGEEFLWSELGKPYGMKQLIGYLWVLFCRCFGRNVRNPFADGNLTYVCVEFMARYLGIKNAESITPHDLYLMVVDHLNNEPV